MLFLVLMILTPAGMGTATGTGTGTGTGNSIVLGFAVLLIAGLVLVSLAAVLIDTLRLRASVPHIRPLARAHARRHPLYAHAYQYPPSHRVSGVFAWIVMLFLFLFGIFTLPGLVDGAAYFTGAEPAVTFMPTSYTYSCSQGDSTRCGTDGILENSGASAEWPDRVPLGRPMTVREPLWNWGFGNSLIDGTGTAVGLIVAGSMMGAFDVLIAVFAVKLIRRRRLHRREAEELLTAPWAR